MTFDIGDDIRLGVTFTNASDAVADPSTVSLKVKTPGGVTTTYAYGGGVVLKDSTGVYHASIPIPLSAASVGGWEYRFEGTGAVTAAGEDCFDVRESSFY